MATHAFGALEFATEEFGDGAGNPKTVQTSAIGVTYNILSGGGAGITINYLLQITTGNGLPIFYTALSPISTFTINGTTVRGPTDVTYSPPSQVAYDMSGVPLRQGYTSVEWDYNVLLDSDMATIMTLYNPLAPQVTITYPNELGIWVAKAAMMQPPNLGTRSTIEHQNVKLVFTHISSD